MERLSEDQVRALSRFLGDLYATHSIDALRRQIVDGLPRLLRCGSVSYNEVDLRRQRVCLLREPTIDPKLQAAFVRHFHEHPGYRLQLRGGDTRAVRLSDHLSRRAYHRLGLYTEYYRHAGVEHQLTTTLGGPDPLYLAVAVNRERGRDFTDRDVLLLRLIGDHLRAVHDSVRAAEAAERDLTLTLHGLDRMGRIVIIVRGGRCVRGLTARARMVFARYFGAHYPVEGGLPVALASWLRREASGPNVGSPRMPLVVEGPGRRLTARLHAESTGAVIVLEEHATAADLDALEVLSLSRREAEVLGWVTEGKTDPEIASILGLSVRTIHHHLAHIYAKLRVGTRTAAVAVALQASIAAAL